ncbi:DNA polymerase III subunit gamma/tau C-terminal domain-containing protein [Psychromonas sp. MME1]
MPEEELPPIDSYLSDEMRVGTSNEADLPSPLENDNGSDLNSHDAFTNNHHGEQPLAAIQSNTEHEEVLLCEQLIETPTIDIAKYVEDKISDSWSLAIQQMQLLGLVKLLAKNSVMQQVDKKMILTLKAEQQHLLNDHTLCEQLQESLKAHYGNDRTMYIEVGDVAGAMTPIEYEFALFQQYLDAAKQAIKEDKLVKILQKEYAAKIYENSIIPL